MGGYMSHGFRLERKDADYSKKFYGKYRATVTNNVDDDTSTGRMGRLKVKCPAVLGEDESNWCTPCVPYAGPSKGVLFMPRVGETVWIEFEGGDPDKPIWVGNWWGTDERPDPINESYDKKEVGLHHVIETEKVKMHFDDKNTVFSITVGTATFVMDGKESTIQIHVGGATIDMDGKAPTITANAPTGIFLN